MNPVLAKSLSLMVLLIKFNLVAKDKRREPKLREKNMPAKSKYTEDLRLKLQKQL